jgi:hypothetical protein
MHRHLILELIQVTHQLILLSRMDLKWALEVHLHPTPKPQVKQLAIHKHQDTLQHKDNKLQDILKRQAHLIQLCLQTDSTEPSKDLQRLQVSLNFLLSVVN